jgi:branched-chain amino acid transport system ATP-binding protein
VLLLDEPASGLDGSETDEFAEIIGSLAESGMSVLLVEHDVPLVMRACSTIYVLDFGKIIASGSPQEIQSNATVLDAYLGTRSTS